MVSLKWIQHGGSKRKGWSKFVEYIFKKNLILFSTAVLIISLHVSSRDVLNSDPGTKEVWLHCNPPLKQSAWEGRGCRLPRNPSQKLAVGMPTLLTARTSFCMHGWCLCCHCLASNTVRAGVSVYIMITAQLINSEEPEVLPKTG